MLGTLRGEGSVQKRDNALYVVGDLFLTDELGVELTDDLGEALTE